MANKNMSRRDFPSDFVFGAATSAYQVEGGYDADGKSLSNWDAYTLRRPERIQDGTNGCVATDQYHKYKEDVMMMKKLGLQAYRFSISWSRVLPGGRLSCGVNKEGVQYYNDLINFCISQKIEPYVTIFHFDLPQCLEDEYGGFLNRKIVQDFAEFAELCFWEFGDRVKNWITLNEPWTFAHNAYVVGAYPPGHGDAKPLTPVEPIRPVALTKSNANFLISGMDNIGYFTSTTPRLAMPISTPHRCPTKIWRNASRHTEIISENIAARSFNMAPNLFIANSALDGLVHDVTKELQIAPPGNAGTEPYTAGYHLILAHATAVDIYKKWYQGVQKGKIGITNMTTWFEPLNDTEEDKAAASRALDFMWGWFMKPIVHGDYPDVMKEKVGTRLPGFSDEEKKLIKGSYDFIGLNYYTTCYVVNAPQLAVANPNYYTDREVALLTAKDGNPIGECPGSPWLYIVPKGIHSLLVHTKECYKNPLIYITENGMSEVNNPSLTVTEALKDDKRVKCYRDHLTFTKKAIDEDGVNVKAYFLWSMLDNYEWAEGYSVRFGIFYVDFVNHLARYPKKSAIWWMNFLDKDIASLLERNNDSDSTKPAEGIKQSDSTKQVEENKISETKRQAREANEESDSGNRAKRQNRSIA